jgi:hypothetical protein
MKYFLGLFCLVLTGCFYTKTDYNSPGYRQFCQRECQKDKGTDVTWVGSLSGTCYCDYKP